MNWKRIAVTFLLSLLSFLSLSQTYLSEAEAIELAVKQFPLIKASDYKVEQQKALLPSAFNFYNTQLLLQSPTGEDMRISVGQIIEFPTVYSSQKQVLKQQVKISEAEKEISLIQLKYNVRSTFNNLLYAIEKEELMKKYDSVMKSLVKVNELRYQVGQIPLLEKVNAEARYQLIFNQLRQAKTDRLNFQLQLSFYFGKPGDTLLYPKSEFKKLSLNSYSQFNFDTNLVNNPIQRLHINQINYSKKLLKLERHRLLPGLMAGYFNQSAPNTPINLRFNYGITFPIAIWAYRSRIKSAQKAIKVEENNKLNAQNKLYSDYIQAFNTYQQFSKSLEFFETTGTIQANQIRESAEKSYKSGSIGYYIYIQNIEQAFQVEAAYKETLKNYNQSIINLKYLKGDL